MIAENQPAYNIDIPAVQNWLELLYGQCSGYMSIVSTMNWAGRKYDNLSEAVQYVQDLDRLKTKGIYARVSTLREQLTEGRGGDEDSLMLPGLWADMDLAGPGHKTSKPLPQTIEDCKKIVLEAGLPDPTLWVHSGGGVYPWWLFDEPWTLDGGWIKLAQEISRVWHDAIAASAEELGFHYGPVPDLSRVLRIPGTVNRKVDDDPRPCRIIEFGGDRFTQIDIASVAELAQQLLQERRPPIAPPPAAPSSSPAAGTRPGDELAARMSWSDILTPYGYRLVMRRGVEEYWVRPGKDPRDGHSVTTNYAGSDLMWVFSTECVGFDADMSYSKFATWSILNGYGTDFSAAARAIGGYTGPSESQFQVIKEILGDEHTPPPPPPAEPPTARPSGRPERAPDLTDTGNGQRMRKFFGHMYRYVDAFNGWMRFNGVSWERDNKHGISRAA